MFRFGNEADYTQRRKKERKGFVNEASPRSRVRMSDRPGEKESGSPTLLISDIEGSKKEAGFSKFNKLVSLEGGGRGGKEGICDGLCSGTRKGEKKKE